MNRKDRRVQAYKTRERRKELPTQLTELPNEEWPTPHGVAPLRVWMSKQYLVQLYSESMHYDDGLMRLSVCRSTRNVKGSWQDGITWDELYSIKSQVGFGDWYGIEIYPREADLVNVSNMRHLWLLPQPLNIGWFEGGKR